MGKAEDGTTEERTSPRHTEKTMTTNVTTIVVVQDWQVRTVRERCNRRSLSEISQ